MADRKFLFEYRFAGQEWGIQIHAADAAEAREKIKAVAWAQYKGEVHATISVPWGNIIGRMMERWRQ